MRTKITNCQKQVLFKVSNGIRIYREESFIAPTQVQTKSPLKRPLFIVSLVAIAVSSIFFPFSIFNQPALGSFVHTAESVPNTVFSEQPSLPAGQVGLELPVRLKIPKINVDAALEPVGLTSQGAVDVPKGPANAGWFDLGPRPGEKGSSVIDGHFGWWKNGTQAVFDNLDKLRKGDKVYIEDETGATITFVVRESRMYNPNADATDVFGSNDGKVHLNLITCDGVWDKVAKGYSQRLVVFTDKEM
jgi:LPXTG-site transpeptidase (sortase) family protein